MVPATVRPDREQIDRATFQLHRRQWLLERFSVSYQDQLLLMRYRPLGSLDRYFNTSYAVATLISMLV